MVQKSGVSLLEGRLISHFQRRGLSSLDLNLPIDRGEKSLPQPALGVRLQGQRRETLLDPEPPRVHQGRHSSDWAVIFRHSSYRLPTPIVVTKRAESHHALMQGRLDLSRRLGTAVSHREGMDRLRPLVEDRLSRGLIGPQ